ncbi:unnamed protein product [Litomosoides sigmodontis]|uniref:Uncharacterized protein n=1 Tax=Litomosoides sigmodontis TaxID=42156 RepID=A0A3P6TJW2_LITSI|nr:unnamed protein product [Litomosoides sigmodontis]
MSGRFSYGVVFWLRSILHWRCARFHSSDVQLFNFKTDLTSFHSSITFSVSFEGTNNNLSLLRCRFRWTKKSDS